MFAILKLFWFLWNTGWSIVNPNLNPMRNAPVHIKYFATVILACFWSLAFCLYTAQFFFIGLNMLAHIAIISVAFLTWTTFKGFKRTYPVQFPQMRDPKFLPKCYDMTDAEKMAAVNRADQLLAKG